MNVFFISMGWLLPALIAMGVWDERYRRIPNRVLLVLLLLYLAAWPVLAYTLDNVSIDDYLPLFFQAPCGSGRGASCFRTFFSLATGKSGDGRLQTDGGRCTLSRFHGRHHVTLAGVISHRIARSRSTNRTKGKKDSDIGLCSASCRSRYSILSSPFGMEDTIEMGI